MTPATAAQTPLTPSRLRLLFGGLLLAMLLAALDSTIVATALPTIVGELGGVDRLSWVVTAYLLAQTIVIPLYGKLGDLYGRRIVLQSAVVIFLAGSALCGTATSMTGLILFRMLQGLGGGGLIVTAQAAIGDVVSVRQRGRYQGVLGAAFGVASVAGPLLGGFFTSQLSWRWIFYINLPLGLLALAMVGATLPSRRGESRQVDYAGAALLSIALGGSVLVTDLGGLAYPWTSPLIVGLAAAAAAAAGAFLVVERRAPEPILPLRLLADRTFLVVAAVGGAVGFALFGSVTYLPMFLQLVRGSSPTGSGLEMTPMMAGTLLTSIGTGQLITRYGHYRAFPIAGTAIAAGALWLLSHTTLQTSSASLVVRLAMLGMGLGLVTQVLVIVAQNAARYDDLGVATSAATMFRLIGGSVGTAVLGAAFAREAAKRLSEAGIHAAAGASALHGITAERLAAMPPPIVASYREAITAGMSTVFTAAAAVAAAGFVLTWLIEQRPLRETVAAASSSPGRDAGEAFAMPGTGDPSFELLRGLAMLADRDVRRAYVQGIVARAGLDLTPGAAWLLLRLHEHPAADPVSLGQHEGIDVDRIEIALSQLRQRGYVDAPGDRVHRHWIITPEGLRAHERLATARRERLAGVLEQWPPADRQRLAVVLRRLARELVPPAPDAARDATLSPSSIGDP